MTMRIVWRALITDCPLACPRKLDLVKLGSFQVKNALTLTNCCLKQITEFAKKSSNWMQNSTQLGRNKIFTKQLFILNFSDTSTGLSWTWKLPFSIDCLHCFCITSWHILCSREVRYKSRWYKEMMRRVQRLKLMNKQRKSVSPIVIWLFKR